MVAAKTPLHEARIFSLILIPLLGQYVLTLEHVEDERLVPIWIGVNEGNAIGLKLQNEQLPRPMTHDLVANLLQAFGATLQQVIISDLKEGTYFATLVFGVGKQAIKLDARPSDALALAVRAQAPILIHKKVLEQCPVIMKPISGEDVEKFKEALQSLKPEDFFKGMDGLNKPDSDA